MLITSGRGGDPTPANPKGEAVPEPIIGLSAMGATFAERKAAREAMEAQQSEPSEKAVESAENKSVPRKRTASKRAKG